MHALIYLHTKDFGKIFEFLGKGNAGRVDKTGQLYYVRLNAQKIDGSHPPLQQNTNSDYDPDVKRP